MHSGMNTCLSQKMKLNLEDLLDNLTFVLLVIALAAWIYHWYQVMH